MCEVVCIKGGSTRTGKVLADQSLIGLETKFQRFYPQINCVFLYACLRLEKESGHNLLLPFVQTFKESMGLGNIINTDLLYIQFAAVTMTFQQFLMLGAYLQMGRFSVHGVPLTVRRGYNFIINCKSVRVRRYNARKLY